MRQTVLILGVVPLAALGGLIALHLTGETLNVASAVGFIALFGVAVQNGIIMIANINRVREQGVALHEAVLSGAVERFRPVLMTATVATVGMLPAALATGIGTDVQRAWPPSSWADWWSPPCSRCSSCRPITLRWSVGWKASQSQGTAGTGRGYLICGHHPCRHGSSHYSRSHAARACLLAPHCLACGNVIPSPCSSAGCAVGPDFQRPDAPLVERYTPQPLPAQTASAEVKGGEAQRFVHDMDIPGQWWTLFHSKPLDDLIVQALKANPDMEAAQAALEGAWENVYAQQGAFFPER